MVCPKCGSQNVNIMSEQTGSKTSAKGNGCLWGMARTLLIICTCGLWLLVGKHKGTGKTIAICQSCGNKWKV